MASNAEILREAGASLDMEASNSSFNALLEAAGDVAEQTGLPSPLPNRSASKERFAFTEGARGDTDTDGGKSPSHAVTHTGGGIMPKQDLASSPQRSAGKGKKAGNGGAGGSRGSRPDKTVTINEQSATDDLTRKLAGMTAAASKPKPKTTGTTGGSLSASSASSGFQGSKPPSSYGRRRSVQASGTLTISGRSSDEDPFAFRAASAERSALADFLHKSTDKPWEDRIASSFSSYSQEVLFRSMMQMPDTRAQGKGPSRGKDSMKSKAGESETKKEPKKKSARKNDLSQIYASLDDAKECTFKPVITKNPNSESSGDAKASFLERMEMEEDGRRDRFEKAIGEAEYAPIIDKKYCPNCGAKQSYEEVKEKRKLCPNCSVAYCSKISWGDVSGKFFAKQKEEASKKQEGMVKVQNEMEKEALLKRYSRFDRKEGKVVVNEAAMNKALEGSETWNEDMEEGFFTRMEEQLARKQSKLLELDKKIMEDQYPFKPVMPKRNDDDDDDDEGGFMRRLEEDLEKRRAAARKYNKLNKKEAPPHIEKAWKPV